MKTKPRRIIINVLSLILILYGILLIPDSKPKPIPVGEKPAFVWDSDEYWSELEKRFTYAKKKGCERLANSINFGLNKFDSLINILKAESIHPDSPVLQSIEQNIFELSVQIGACPDSLIRFIKLYGNLRTAVKNSSVNWDINRQSTRDRIYRLLYGGRTAIEEIILQSPNMELPEVFVENDEPLATPYSKIFGVKVHSGDILVSRGGAPTSALIARGNDYPGNFSHIALVHVDENTGEVSIIESHIEIGVAIADIVDYFNDKKLRVMILRLRHDHPILRTDPMLPHKAATYALNRARTEHIAYDFAMDTDDPKKLFCSEVASDAYRRFDVELWSTVSYISTVGVRNWLAAFGVEHFITMEPSDLEYDPQVKVVAEWRDKLTLFKDHLDNAVVDIMLESAENGVELDYNLFMLPIARVLKGYSYILNLFDQSGPVPEGMSATAALKNEWFSQKHEETVDKLILEVEQFILQNGYFPPYWELINSARRVYSQ